MTKTPRDDKSLFEACHPDAGGISTASLKAITGGEGISIKSEVFHYGQTFSASFLQGFIILLCGIIEIPPELCAEERSIG